MSGTSIPDRWLREGGRSRTTTSEIADRVSGEPPRFRPWWRVGTPIPSDSPLAQMGHFRVPSGRFSLPCLTSIPHAADSPGNPRRCRLGFGASRAGSSVLCAARWSVATLGPGVSQARCATTRRSAVGVPLARSAVIVWGISPVGAHRCERSGGRNGRRAFDGSVGAGCRKPVPHDVSDTAGPPGSLRRV